MTDAEPEPRTGRAYAIAAALDPAPTHVGRRGRGPMWAVCCPGHKGDLQELTLWLKGKHVVGYCHGPCSSRDVVGMIAAVVWDADDEDRAGDRTGDKTDAEIVRDV